VYPAPYRTLEPHEGRRRGGSTTEALFREVNEQMQELSGGIPAEIAKKTDPRS
jgi:hypothetical protein